MPQSLLKEVPFTDQDWFDHELGDGRFAALLKCGNKACGEIVALSGETRPMVREGDEHPEELFHDLKPKGMFPAPPIINIPDGASDAVRAELRLAFQLFWSDLGACVGKMRTSVERLMDQSGVKKTFTKGGKRYPQALNNRIDAFKKSKPEYEHILHALRTVGNLGTHKNANLAPVLDAFRIYEHALDDLFNKPGKEVQRIAKKILRTKGVYVKARKRVRRANV